jgi:uncharacterized protein YndB with AHSA1/START domain
MTDSSAIHETFTIERTYAATTARVFAAFSSAEAKSIWGDTGEFEPADGDAGMAEFDFRAGGRERFGIKMDGRTLRYDALYYDIVPDERIVYAYEMYSDDVRMSVSLATVEFSPDLDGTRLTYTEQGVFLDGIDGPVAPSLRQEGMTEMLDNLPAYLQTQVAATSADG